MTKLEPFSQADLVEVLEALLSLDHAATSELALVQERLPELRRQARARSKRRGGPGSPDAEKYRLGSALTLLGFSGFDDVILLGLFASGDRGLKWISEARVDHGPLPFAQLVRIAIGDSRREQWCREWGDYHWKTYRKSLYEASVSDFEKSGRTGLRENWRVREVTRDQAYVINEICEAAKLDRPDLENRGAAFDWIQKQGGNPAYWTAPALPPELEV